MRHMRPSAMAIVAVVCCTFAGAVSAAPFPVTGTVTINGTDSGALPDGSTFSNATYNPNNGDLSAGSFVFPEATVSFAGGTGSVTYQMTQSNTSKGFVGEDGLAFLTNATMSLRAIRAVYGIAINLGSDCIFGPIHWNNLWGSTTANGLELMQASFTVPPTTGSCGGYASVVNSNVAGNNNSIELVIHGTFATPVHSDLIFVNGFEP